MDAPQPLTIGIDARAAAEVPAGRGRVVRELLRALAGRPEDGSRYVLYARERWQCDALDARFRWRLLDARDPLWHLRAARAANRECGVFLSSNSYLTTWFLRIPAVPVVYDLVAFERAHRPNRRSAAIERLTLGTAVPRCAGFLAISEATAADLQRRFPMVAGRVSVAPLGVSPRLAAEPSLAESAELPAPGFVLAVGTLEPRKNLPRLVAAYSGLDERLQAQHPLVVVGALGWEAGETLAALQSLGERGTLLGYVSDAALAELYRRCAIFAYPSLYEGFGLPVLEAMAAGAAVLTSNVSSLPEVGGDAVAYANPLSVTEIAVQLRSLLSEDTLRADLAARARVRAREFSWGRFAETTLGALRAAAGLQHSAGAPESAASAPLGGLPQRVLSKS